MLYQIKADWVQRNVNREPFLVDRCEHGRRKVEQCDLCDIHIPSVRVINKEEPVGIENRKRGGYGLSL